MPFRNARKPRRNVVRRRRTGRRRFVRRARVTRSVGLKRTAYKTHFFTRWLNLGSVYEAQGGGTGTQGLSMGQTGSTTFSYANGWFYNTISAATTSYATLGYAAQMLNLPNFTEFTALFDQYRILGVAIHLTPAINMFQGQHSDPVWNGSATVQGVGSSLSVPVIHYSYDSDDATAPPATEAGLNEMRERWNYKIARLDGQRRMFSTFFKPKVALVVATATTTTAGVQRRSPWIDSADPDIAHNGIKMILEVLNNSGSTLSVNYKIEAKLYLQCRGSH